MPRGLKKLTHAASTQAAWRDWRAIQSWCDQNGRGELAGRHTPSEGAGWKTVDNAITALRADLGAPSGPWGNNVLEGLQTNQQQLPLAVPKVRNVAYLRDDQLEAWDVPAAYARIHEENRQREQQQPDHEPAQLHGRPEPRPSRPAEENAFGVRVWNAYQALAGEMQSPDVPLHALARRVGGDIRDLHQWLRQECLAHRAVPSTGEPAFAGDAARQSALTIPGETDRTTGRPVIFLNIKLIEPPTMQEQQQTPVAEPVTVVTLTAYELQLLRETVRHQQDRLAQGEQDMTLEIQELDVLDAKLQVAQGAPEHQRYEGLLRATADLRYPERTAELEARIEKTIQKKVGDFLQEQQHRERVRLYEASLRRQLAEKNPTLTPAEREHYEQRIAKLVEEYRQNQTQRQPQQAQTPPALSQEQGRGPSQEIER